MKETLYWPGIVGKPYRESSGHVFLIFFQTWSFSPKLWLFLIKNRSKIHSWRSDTMKETLLLGLVH